MTDAVQRRIGRDSWVPSTGRKVRRGLLAAAVALMGACQSGPDAGPLGAVAWVRADSLFIQALPTGTPRLIAVAAGLREPRWSPSGQWLALRTGTTLRLVRSDGSGGQKLAEGATDFSWAPTDDRIAYVAGGNLIVARAGGIGVVLFDRTASATAAGLAWSPDGAWLALGVVPSLPSAGSLPPQTPIRPGLMLVPARGGVARRLPLPDLPLSSAPLLRGWTGNGRSVVVAMPGAMLQMGMVPGTMLNVYSVPATEPGPGPAGSRGPDSAASPGVGPTPALLADSGFAYADFVAPAPRWAGVAVVTGSGSVTWRGKGLVLATGGKRVRLSAPDRAAIAPAWSADGTRLAWAEMPDVPLPAGVDSLSARRVVVAGVSRGGAVQAVPLGGAPGRQEAPRWTADGRHVLFVAVAAGGSASLRLGAPGEQERVAVPVLGLPAGADATGRGGYLPWSDVFDYWAGPPARH